MLRTGGNTPPDCPFCGTLLVPVSPKAPTLPPKPCHTWCKYPFIPFVPTLSLVTLLSVHVTLGQFVVALGRRILRVVVCQTSSYFEAPE